MYILIISNVEKKGSDKIIPKSNKIAREDIENTILTVLFNQASTSSITEEPIRTSPNYLSLPWTNKTTKTMMPLH